MRRDPAYWSLLLDSDMHLLRILSVWPHILQRPNGYLRRVRSRPCSAIRYTGGFVLDNVPGTRSSLVLARTLMLLSNPLMLLSNPLMPLHLALSLLKSEYCLINSTV